MPYAAFCDALVLGVGDTPSDALNDAAGYCDYPDDECSIALITPEAAIYVENGGDSRGLVLGETSAGSWIFRLRDPEPTS